MLTIAWDVDDVLNGLMRSWLELEWLPKHPECLVKYENITENPPCRILGISEREYLKSLDAFRISDKAGLMKPDDDILNWFQKYGRHARHLAITGRPVSSIPQVSGWVFKYFGNWVRTFSFVPDRVEEGIIAYDANKSEYLKWLGKVDIFVDDNFLNVKAVDSLGIKGILIPQPWNAAKIPLQETLNLLTKILNVPND
ncbi:MAG: hypothetical protein WCY05_00125 [Candidatus Omnitrophota bacterium]